MQRTAWKMKDLRRGTARVIKSRSGVCSASLVRSDLKKLVWDYRVECSDADSDASGYLCRISIPRLHKGERQDFSREPEDYHVRVSCECPFFQYWGPGLISENQDFQRGGPRTNGSPPKVNTRNPDGTSVQANLLCKHLMAASDRWFHRRFKNKRDQ